MVKITGGPSFARACTLSSSKSSTLSSLRLSKICSWLPFSHQSTSFGPSPTTVATSFKPLQSRISMPLHSRFVCSSSCLKLLPINNNGSFTKTRLLHMKHAITQSLVTLPTDSSPPVYGSTPVIPISLQSKRSGGACLSLCFLQLAKRTAGGWVAPLH